MSISEKINDWFMNGDIGLSSKCMVKHLTGKHTGFADYPHDPSDFSRCLGLIEAVPELRKEIHRMKELNPMWAAIVNNWDDIERLFNEEKGNRNANKTYLFMKKILRPAEEKDKNIVKLGEGVTLRFGK